MYWSHAAHLRYHGTVESRYNNVALKAKNDCYTQDIVVPSTRTIPESLKYPTYSG